MEVPKEKLLEVYRQLVTARRLDERLIAEYSKEPFGPYIHSGAYQEVAPVVASLLLGKKDFIKLHHRFGYCQHAKGVPLKEVVAGEMFRKVGPRKSLEFKDYAPEYGLLGKSGSLGEDVPIYTGAALAQQIKKTGGVTVCIFGDGSSSRGPIHEAMLVAGVWKLPIVYVIINNRYAVSTPVSQQTANTRLSDRALGYGMPGYEVDGNDVLAFYEVCDRAIKMAREGKGPSLISANTYRIYGHSFGDSQTYRPKGEAEEWRKLDPIPRYQKLLIDRGVLTEELAGRIEAEVLAELEEAVKYGRSLPVPPVEDLARTAFD